MSLTDATLLLAIGLFLAWAIYLELILPHRHGKTGLRVALQRRNRLDSLIFVGLLAILLWQNLQHQGTALTTTLLLALALMAIYLFWLRQPVLLLKPAGFYYAVAFIRYERIRAMNLSEDGVLVITLEQRQLLIQVRELDDLERIYHFLTGSQPAPVQG